MYVLWLKLKERLCGGNLIYILAQLAGDRIYHPNNIIAAAKHI